MAWSLAAGGGFARRGRAPPATGPTGLACRDDDKDKDDEEDGQDAERQE